MNVLVLSGSPRKGDSYHIVKRVEEKMQELGEVGFEYIRLGKMNIEYCRGCLACMKKGEDRCPLKDDVPAIREKMLAADAVIFASPVYIHTMTAPIKSLFDRLAYYLHRPCFHRKHALLVSTTELSGLKETLHHLAFPVKAMGFNIAAEIGIIAPAFDIPGPYREKELANIEMAAGKLFYAVTNGQAVKPRLSDVIFFNKLATKITMHKDKFPADYAYWQDNNWFETDYFYPAKINAIKKAIGKLPVKLIKFVLKKKLGVEGYQQFVGLKSQVVNQA